MTCTNIDKLNLNYSFSPFSFWLRLVIEIAHQFPIGINLRIKIAQTNFFLQQSQYHDFTTRIQKKYLQNLHLNQNLPIWT